MGLFKVYAVRKSLRIYLYGVALDAINMENMKLSDMAEQFKQKFDYVSNRLYVKGNNGKCRVCYLGGIALTVAPERFTPNEHGDLADKDGCIADYEEILKCAGVPEEVRHLQNGAVYNYKFIDKFGKEQDLVTAWLSRFIFLINDEAGNWDEVAKALRKYNL